ncbi:hypothetical protein EW145_g4226 [Phellinidium pouzarii]|uniref:Protein kinase domain-containing protein n=1 Tax=Phellinidium pouzarii TaxID=167371 RepID=A0A4S4L9D4_9AGAM|nr:hypothetical protein EW145_g4226 [Phellinidium pouzarii]
MSFRERPTRFRFACDYTLDLTNIGEFPVGSGGFSSVYKGKLHGKDVAIKVLRHVPNSKDTLAEVRIRNSLLAQREYKLWHPLRHPYILSLEGICFFREEHIVPSFISYWQKNGRITDFVSRRPYVDIIRMLGNIALGICYLHENDIIHGDIRGSNIMISDSGDPLVTDFGIAKEDSGNGVQMSTAMNGNCRWMAHEFFRHHNGKHIGADARRTKASDVWSLGMLFQEVLSGEPPYHEHNLATLFLKIGSGILPSFSRARHAAWRKYDIPMRTICSRCWALEPDERPSMSQLIADIRTLRPKLSGDESEINNCSFAEDARSQGSSVSRATIDRSTEEQDTFRLSNLMNNVSLNSSRGFFSESPPSTPHQSSPELYTQNIPRVASEPRTFCPSHLVELENLLVSSGLKNLFNVEYESRGSLNQLSWYAICYLRGEEIGKGCAESKKSAFAEAAKIVLAKLGIS